jgi:hypothetical protein
MKMSNLSEFEEISIALAIILDNVASIQVQSPMPHL